MDPGFRRLKTGWGGRDRTYECRNQNPVPYHLATPQNYSSTKSCRGWRSNPCATKPLIPDGTCANADARCRLGGELGKYARTGARHCRHPWAVELLEPLQVRATSGYRRHTTGSRSLCPRSTEKGGILIGIVFRVNSLLPKTCAVETCTGGVSTRYQAGGRSIA